MNKLKIALFLASIGIIASCKKYSQIDTSNTIKVPYVLYMGGQGGEVYSTNDAYGANYNSVFSYDGSVTNQILISDSNILLLKDMVSLSQNKKSFHVLPMLTNYVYPNTTNNLRLNIKNTALWDSKNKRTFLCDAGGFLKSVDNGVTWNALSTSNPTEIDTPSYMVGDFSITQTTNGDVYVLTLTKFLMKSTGGGAFNTIPHASATALNNITALSPYPLSISHVDNNLIAFDMTGTNGAYISTNSGLNWTQATGLPANKRILFGNQVDGGEYFLGTDSAGLYRLDASGTNFVHSDGGLPPYARVYDVVGKHNVYTTNDSKYYIFAATNLGLYISENAGSDWRFVHAGSYTALW